MQCVAVCVAAAVEGGVSCGRASFVKSSLCCSVLQCALQPCQRAASRVAGNVETAVCYNVLQCVAVCCSLLQCALQARQRAASGAAGPVSECCDTTRAFNSIQLAACTMLHLFAVYCSVLQL